MKHSLKNLCIAAAAVAAASSAHAATVIQTTSANANVYWNTATPWGSVPSAGNTYVSSPTATGAGTNGTSLGPSLNVATRVRDNGTTFAGDSLTIAANTELLLKQNNGATSSANVTLDGGVLRLAPDSGGTGTLAGTLSIASNSILGVVHNNTATTFTISSTLTGSSLLRLAAGGGINTHKLNFTGDLSAFTGTLQVGGGNNLVAVNFDNGAAGDFDLADAVLTMGGFSTLDVLNLTDNLMVGAFNFGANSLAAGTYTAVELNTLYGNGSQFTGPATLTVVPEPGAALLGALGVLGLLRRRRN